MNNLIVLYFNIVVVVFMFLDYLLSNIYSLSCIQFKIKYHSDKTGDRTYENYEYIVESNGIEFIGINFL